MVQDIMFGYSEWNYKLLVWDTFNMLNWCHCLVLNVMQQLLIWFVWPILLLSTACHGLFQSEPFNSYQPIWSYYALLLKVEVLLSKRPICIQCYKQFNGKMSDMHYLNNNVFKYRINISWGKRLKVQNWKSRLKDFLICID